MSDSTLPQSEIRNSTSEILPAYPARPLPGLITAQFFSTFNDNAWKMIAITIALAVLNKEMPNAPQAEIDSVTQFRTALGVSALTGALFLFALPAGMLSDRFSKQRIVIVAKTLELLFLILGTVLLWRQPEAWTWLVGITVLMGIQTAILSPAKLGLLPEIVPHTGLSRANGLMEMFSFLAIIGGMALGPLLWAWTAPAVWHAGALLTAVSVIGLVAAFTIPQGQRIHNPAGFLATIAAAARDVRHDRTLKFAVLGQVIYWGIASLMSQDILVYTKSLELADGWLGFKLSSEALTGLPLAAIGLGAGVGCVLAGKISGPKVEYGLIPIGGLGIALGCILTGWWGPSFNGTLLMMLLLGAASGFIIVPLQAIVQWRAPAERRGAVIALSNTLINGGSLLASLAAALLAQAHFSPRAIMIFSGLFMAASTLWACWLVPDSLLRLALLLFTNTFYRLRVLGSVNIPVTGPALLAPNHVSFIDAILLTASTDRPIRFLMDRTLFETWYIRPIVTAARAIPIDARGGPREVLGALREAGKCLDNGDVVCIFPEGQITRTGMMQPFRRGIERIVKGRDVPIIPVHLDRVWGSMFSFSQGRFLFKWPTRIPYPVTVSFGAPVPSATPVPQLRQLVQDLGHQAWIERKRDSRPLHRSFIRSARRRPFRLAFGDASVNGISRMRALSGAIALARRLHIAGQWSNQPRVGILLPPSVGGALANLAAALAGRTAVNLNYTVGAAVFESCAKQAGLQTILTTQLFLEKAKVTLPADVKPIFIDDVIGQITRKNKLAALFRGWWWPKRMLERYCGATRRTTLDDEATIIFSSGSTGDPKGVILTHFNIDANVEGVAQVFPMEPRDRLLGILPFFHSFGFMTLWLAATHGLPVVFHNNPLDAATVGRLAEHRRLTILIATPTFLQLYLRRLDPGQLGSIRLVLTGAEKLSQEFADLFLAKFGVRPIEGYGTTECSPVIAVSTLDVRRSGIYQPGSRRGFVGQPLPGVTVRITDPENPDPQKPLTFDAPGMLLVRGPNLMKGYLGRPDLTAKVIKDGWYITGDIAVIDEDGFLKITDRLSRFSKIGGEMVPHGKVEEALQQASAEPMQVFAVTAVPDEKKGERLVVLHTLNEDRIPEIHAKIAASGLPNLFLPRQEQFFKVEALPMLGTGKLDLRAIKQTALQRSTARAAEAPNAKGPNANDEQADQGEEKA